MSYTYVLNADHSVERMDDVVEWENRFSNDNNVVSRTVYGEKPNEVMVSTVFIGIDHRYGHEEGLPLLFETMVFAKHIPSMDTYCERCSTYTQAKEQHAKVCELVKTTLENQVSESSSSSSEASGS
jgi:hypothetical protein